MQKSVKTAKMLCAICILMFGNSHHLTGQSSSFHPFSRHELALFHLDHPQLLHAESPQNGLHMIDHWIQIYMRHFLLIQVCVKLMMIIYLRK